MTHQDVLDMLVRHEGLRLFPYTDTVGKITIGCGRNLTDCGLSTSEAMDLLQHDLDAVIADLATFDWFPRLDSVRQAALVDLRFNLGQAGFRRFRKMLAALAQGDYATAAGQAANSRWYSQTGQRGVTVVRMLATGMA